MCYKVFKPTNVYMGTMIPIFDVEQVYLLGGINFICMEVCTLYILILSFAFT